MQTKDSITQQHIKAINWSLTINVLMFSIKWIAYLLSNSTAIFSEAIESIANVLAVAFAYYALRLSHKPEDEDHPYGHERIIFFSAGFEGLLICVAAGIIFFESVQNLLLGVRLKSLDVGLVLIAIATIAQLILGKYLVNLGKKTNALLIKANGQHLLTDFWTSAGVLVGLLLVYLTDYYWLDPIFAIALAAHILWGGFRLLKESIDGLMDRTNPKLTREVKKLCIEMNNKHLTDAHNIKTRSTGNSTWVDLHLIFPDEISLRIAHLEATKIERHIAKNLEGQVFVNSHLEPDKHHDQHHADH